jgi:hypothetical protein
MLARLRPRSFYDVLSVIACFAALTTGAAYAANTIGSVDVIDESLLSQDIKNGEVKLTEIAVNSINTNKIIDGQVRAGDVGANAIKGVNVIDNALTGADIAESTLGPVPEAGTLDGRDSLDFLGATATAADSDLLDGMDSKGFARLGGLVNGDGTVLQGSGFTVARPNQGEYQISFPSGTLSNANCPPVAVAMPFSGIVRHPHVTGRSCSGFGAGSFTIKTLDADAVAQDTPFLFIAM